MSFKTTVDQSQIDDWAIIAAQAASDKKASDTVIIRVGELLGITDLFVITSAPNTRQVKTIANEIEEQIKRAGGPAPRRVEGLSAASWVLLDYGDFVVHVFVDETREFYDLERLWADAPRLSWVPSSVAVVSA